MKAPDPTQLTDLLFHLKHFTWVTLLSVKTQIYCSAMYYHQATADGGNSE